jgi:hypothetical protein
MVQRFVYISLALCSGLAVFLYSSSGTAQRQLLDQRYNLTPPLNSSLKMSRGKTIAVGPTARLGKGVSWQSLAQMAPEEVRKRNLFPSLISASQARLGDIDLVPLC